MGEEAKAQEVKQAALALPATGRGFCLPPEWAATAQDSAGLYGCTGQADLHGRAKE